jgi:hypothetical protein
MISSNLGKESTRGVAGALKKPWTCLRVIPRYGTKVGPNDLDVKRHDPLPLLDFTLDKTAEVLVEAY